MIKFELKGAKEMERLLRALGPEIANKVGDKAVRAGAGVIVKEARRLVRRGKTGALRKSIKVVLERKRGGQNERVAYASVGPPAGWRAHFTEFGTAHSAAHPFLRPALDSKAEEALKAMGKVLARGIEDAALKLAKK